MVVAIFCAFDVECSVAGDSASAVGLLRLAGDKLLQSLCAARVLALLRSSRPGCVGGKRGVYRNLVMFVNVLTCLLLDNMDFLCIVYAYSTRGDP